jgi:tetratricopeptide (TPR) repeat protein
MRPDQLYLSEYFHQLFSLDQKKGVQEWSTAFDVYRNAWLLEDCTWLLRLIKSLPLDKEAQLIVWEQEGLFRFSRHEWEKATTDFQKALLNAQQLGDEHAVARTLGHLGLVEQVNGHLREALDAFKKSDEIFIHLEDRQAHSTNLVNMGGIYDDLGEWKEAEEYYNNALKLKRQLKDRAGEQNLLANLAILRRQQGID